MQNRIEIIEKILKKKHLAPNQSPVFIRELLAIQRIKNGMQYGKGEYYYSTVFTTDQNTIEASRQTPDELLERMFLHIKECALNAANIHQRENCLPSTDSKETLRYTLRPDKVNTITRLSFHEFAFYTSYEFGPLPQQYFTKLITKLETLAGELPDNLHLMLATFPVKLNENIVHNMGVYIECGKNRRINTFAKAMPAGQDPTYDQGQNQHISSSIVNQRQLADLESALLTYIDYLKQGRVDIQVINTIKMLALQDKNNQPPAEFLTITDEFLINLKKNNPDAEQARSFIHAANHFYSNLREKNINAIPALPNLQFITNEDFPSTAIAFGGEFESKTAGGAHFQVSIDICLDHLYAFSKQHFNNKLQHAELTGDRLLPIYGSQLMVSNTAPVLPENLITQTVTHIDPLVSSDNRSVANDQGSHSVGKTIPVDQPIFGSPLDIHVYPEIKLTPHLPSLQARIDKYNPFIIKLQAYHYDRAQHPHDQAKIDHQINQHILEPLKESLGESSRTYAQQYLKKLQTASSRDEIIKILDELSLATKNTGQQEQLDIDINIARSLLRLEGKECKDAQKKDGIDKKSVALIKEIKRNLHALTIESNLPKPAGSETLHEQCELTASPLKLSNDVCVSSPLLTSGITSEASRLTGVTSLVSTVLLLGFFGCHFSFMKRGQQQTSRALTRSDIIILKQNEELLDELSKSFQEKKSKRAYHFGLNAKAYHDVARLLETTRTEILNAIDKNKYTDSSFKMIENNIKSIQEKIKTLTNKDLEKRLRLEEVVIARQMRRKL